MIQWRNSESGFGWVGRILHWTGVALVIAIYVGISGLDVPPKVYERDVVIATHNILGWSLLGLILVRLTWRLRSANPVLGWRLSKGHERLVVTVHRALYVIVIATCVSGWLATEQTAVSLHDRLAMGLLLLLAAHATLALINMLVASVDDR